MTRLERNLPSPSTNRSASSLILISTVIAVPLFLIPAQDSFRFSKELLLRLASILLLVSGAVSLSWRNPYAPVDGVKKSVPLLTFVGVILGWSLITSLTSSNRPLSFMSMLWVTSCTIFFLASHLTSERRTLGSIEWIAVPTMINVAVYVAQELEIWRPFGIQKEALHRGSTALLGNPDDTAMFLVPAALTAVALWRSSEKRGRLHLMTAVAAAATVLWTQTITAVAALAVGLVASSLLIWPSHRRRVLPIALVLAVVLPLGVDPLRHRLSTTITAARAHKFDQMLSGRVLAWAAAWEMVKSNPVTGVGPGCYSWQYFPFRREAESKSPSLLDLRLRHINFGTAHNDQLQLAATSGIPAFALFIAGIWKLAKYSSRHGTTPETRFSRMVAAPLAAAMFVLTTAQFPLELAAPMTIVLYVTGSITGWSIKT